MSIEREVVSMFKVSRSKFRYTQAPVDRLDYTNRRNEIYTRYAKAYDGFMACFPLWKKWLRSVLPYLKGEKLLEVSFGPGYLLSLYPPEFMIHALDYNQTMVDRAIAKMRKLNRPVNFVKGNVEQMPYPDESFDTVVCTMAFSGYADGDIAMTELLRVLKKDGILLLMDYDYPLDDNLFGYLFVKLIERSGDIIKDIGAILDNRGCTYERKIVGAFGSIQLFVIRKEIN
ncbi:MULTISPECIES: class I SAM-dependent methyltransferase [unclassified Fusibacter]|uniref:class I SAM-dependent methyltransferase n=1 Tax=unclassified Fusibacter TaxID=2624464 RepID=UPI0010103104|nr:MULTISPECIES: class I SAM-dependent methyltransferase [unclassified Fusibacter]MCK8058934.1 class I SAM-dependent methyltransferase [Fusibacter sp. A2]NPE22010.1 methyltransferase domain-containing protein [Fusibacter sp. A1]RXV61575.1 SAM-dependent methyltransferase [Fusibacter sp. A1]